MSKQMDLREALLWCFWNIGESLDVLEAGSNSGPKQIRMDGDCKLYGMRAGGGWKIVQDCWATLLRSDTKFQIPEESTLPAKISEAIDSLDGITESWKKGLRKLVKEILEAKVKP